MNEQNTLENVFFMLLYIKKNLVRRASGIGKTLFYFYLSLSPPGRYIEVFKSSQQEANMEARGLKSDNGPQPLFGEFGRGGGGGPMRGRGFWGGGGSARPGPYDRPSAASGFGRGGMMMGGGGGGGGYPGGMGYGGRVNYTFNSLLIANLSKMLSFFILLE